MTDVVDLQHLTVADLAKRCAQETELFFQRQVQDAKYCFELFRRAIRETDQFAWDMIYAQYKPLVTGWVKQNQAFEVSGEEVEYFVNGAFGKISGILTAERFDGFAEIGSLLRYLKMCVHSVIVDHTRSVDQPKLYPLDDALKEPSTDPTLESQTMDRAYRQAFWDLVSGRLNDEKERLVMEGLFILALKPRELYERSRHKFSDVDEIYRVKQNILARLGRDPEFGKLVGQND
jgi:hypothetical protein